MGSGVDLAGTIPVGAAVLVVLFAGLLIGAPTEISQRCPGCPCGGFIPGAVDGAGAGVTL